MCGHVSWTFVICHSSFISSTILPQPTSNHLHFPLPSSHSPLLPLPPSPVDIPCSLDQQSSHQRMRLPVPRIILAHHVETSHRLLRLTALAMAIALSSAEEGEWSPPPAATRALADHLGANACDIVLAGDPGSGTTTYPLSTVPTHFGYVMSVAG